jgi:hypothetical protein
MKTLYLTILILISVSIKSQIPNPGFETISGGIPTLWNTGPIYSYYTIKDTVVAKTGNHAALLYGYVPPVSGAIVKDFPNYSSSSPIGLTGWYKFYPQLGDSILFDVEVWKMGSYSTRGKNNKLSTAITSSTSVYTQFNIPITYTLPPTYCDSAWVSIYPSGNVSAWGYNWPHPNTIVMVDDLQWAYLTTDISINKEMFNVEKIYPNPTKTIVNIIYTVPFQNKINIRVIDISGRVIETIINDEQSIGRYKVEVDISKIPSGVYYIEIITEIGCISSTPLMIN